LLTSREKGWMREKKLKDIMDMYLETIDKARFTKKRFLPLHRKLKNLYPHNMDLQAQIRRLKLELQPFKEELAQRNLNVLTQAATRRISRQKIMDEIAKEISVLEMIAP
jgi:hypothetical protein